MSRVPGATGGVIETTSGMVDMTSLPRARADGERDRRAEDHEGQGHHRAQRGQGSPHAWTTSQPPTAATRSPEPPQHGPQQAPRALRGEVQRQPQTEEPVGRTDDPEIRRPRGEDVGLTAEETEPEMRREGPQEADGAGHRGRDAGTDPRHALRPRPLPGSEVGPHHGHERRAHAEHERDLRDTRAAPPCHSRPAPPCRRLPPTR